MLAGRALRKTAANTTATTTTTRTRTTIFGSSSSGAFIRARMSSTAAIGGTGKEKVFFGPFEVTTQVFLRTAHSFALVNLKPILPGHVLVCPARPHRRLTDLTGPELADLWLAVQRVQRMLARHYFVPPLPPSPAAAPAEAEAGGDGGSGSSIEAGSFNIAVQDGPEAGQTVAHVHVHVIPRIRDATAKPADALGDELYEQMAAERGNVGGALWDAAAAAEGRGEQGWQQRGAGAVGPRPRPGGGFPRVEDVDRHARSMEEMEAEAAVFRRVLRELEGGDGR